MARTKQTARRSTGGKAASKKAVRTQSEGTTTEERDSGVEMTSSNDTETMEHSDGSSGAYSSSSSGSAGSSSSSSSSSSSEDKESNSAELENLAERVEKLETQAKSFTKEASELRALLVKAGLGVLKKEPKKAEAKAPVKKADTKITTKITAKKEAKETKVEPKKPAVLTEKAISVMTKKDLSAELDRLKVEYKKAALVADLRKLLIKSIKNENKVALVADVKKASEKKETKSKEEKPTKETKKSKESKKTQEKSEEKETKKDVEEKKIEVQITKDLGYGTDKHGFVYELPTGTVIGQLVNNVPAILSKASIKKLKELGLKYEGKTASELKKSIKPFVETKPAVEIESTESTGKKYADDAAEGEETVKKDEDDYIKSSFEEISDSSITKEQFRKVQTALKANEISVSDSIAEIADKTGLEPTIAGKIMVRFVHFSEQWPEVVSETKPVVAVKGGRTLIKPRNK